MMDRRSFMLMLFVLSSVPAMLAMAPAAAAKNGSDDGDSGDSDGGDDDGGDDDDDHDGGDDDGGSSGSGGSGSNDGGDDDDGDDDDSDGSNSGSGSGSGRDHQKAREAVDQGRILPLREILKRVEGMGGGRVIAVTLDLEARKPFYTLKVQSGASVRTLKLDAASGRRLTLFGW